MELENSAQKSQIEQAALQAFERLGYAGATIAEIAAAAGVNPATIYRFFPGKRALFEALGRPELDFPDPVKQERMSEIIQVALQVFSRKGYAAATLDDIAEAAGLSKAGIYFYFPSKEALFLAATEQPVGMVLIQSFLENWRAGSQTDLEDGLVKVAAAYLALFDREDFKSLLRLILSEGTRNPKIATRFTEAIVGRGSEMVTAALARAGQNRGEDLKFKVQALFGMLFSWGLVNRLLATPGVLVTSDLEGIARQYVHLFLFGIESTRMA